MIQIFLGYADGRQGLDKDNAGSVQTGQGPQMDDVGCKQGGAAADEEKALYVRKLEDTGLVRSFFNRLF